MIPCAHPIRSNTAMHAGASSSPAFSRPRRRGLLSTLVVATGVAAFALPDARADEVDDAVVAIQHDWEVIRYQTPKGEREKRFEALAGRAHQLSEKAPSRAEPLVWEGIAVSSWAGEKGGLGALGLVKQAKALYESAMRIDAGVLGGSAYNSLAVLYYKVPGWPIGFGDKDKAKRLLDQAVATNPTGIDANYFYGEYLLETDHPAEAIPYLEKALQAPARPGRQIADVGRYEEARTLLEAARAKLK